MNTETKPKTMQVAKGERYCSNCNTQVAQDTEVCPICKKVLYATGRLETVAALWGGVLGVIAAIVVAYLMGKIGSSNFWPGTIVGGIVFFTVKHYKEAKLRHRIDFDLAVWKHNASSKSTLAQNTGPSSKENSL